MDLDAWIERASIMEFDGGMSRFRAETLAAQAQGFQRREVLDEIERRRNLEKAWDQRAADERHREGALSGVQPYPQEGAA